MHKLGKDNKVADALIHLPHETDVTWFFVLRPSIDDFDPLRDLCSSVKKATGWE